jgi:hypothetical protein
MNTTDFATLRQHDLLTRLLRLSREQGEALEDERLDHFLALMTERERLVDEINALSDAPLPDNVVPFWPLATPRSIPDIQAAINALIVSILDQDEQNEAMLRAQMESLVAALGRINVGYAAARGYAAQMAPEPMPRGLNIAR